MEGATKYFFGFLAIGAAIAGAGAIIYILSRPKNNVTKPVGSILFIGDSNTAANFSYADQLQKRFPALRIKKIAISGEKTDLMLQQLTTELAQNKYDVVSILGGSNDIWATDKIDGAEANLDAMYKLAHANGAKVLAVSPPNHNWYVNATVHKQQILGDLVNWIMVNPNADYKINFWNITNDKRFFNVADGFLHAQEPAHKILADKVTQILNLQ